MCTASTSKVKCVQVFRGNNPGTFISARSGRVAWFDCATCGPVAPKIKTDRGFEFAVAQCSVCDAQGETLRMIAMRTPKRGTTGSKCGGACLSGRVSCDCQCRGRCHGAGVCACN